MHQVRLTLAIVATIADAEDSIDHFVRYHLAIGFDRFYLFIDDNSIITQEILQRYPQVTMFPRDGKLDILWKETPTFADKKKCDLIDAEVMVRQEMNFFVAQSFARKDGVDWMLHMDLDELFYPNGCDIQQHFKCLQLKNYKSITYLNYESITTSPDSSSIYLSSDTFKINFFKNKHWFFSQEQKQLLSNSLLPEKFFLFYQNGKSAINLYGNKIKFYDVHSISGDGNRKLGVHIDPIILHFPCARYSDFLKKYHRLGQFSDYWMDHKRVGDFIDGVHLESRDVVECMSLELVEAFYHQRFRIGKENITLLRQYKMVVEIRFHIDFLSKVTVNEK